MMTIEIDSERSRLRTLLMRTHHMSPQDADQRLADASVSLHVTAGVLNTPAGQAAVLTAILLADRCFGHVRVSGDLDHTITGPKLPIGTNIQDVIATVGATVEDQPTCRTVAIGIYSGVQSHLPCVQAGWNGWRSRSVPGNITHTLGDGDVPLAGIAAAALAVGEAFMAELGDPIAGQRTQEISLWQPESSDHNDPGPATYCLPHALWLIGLGNLGQAYLWCLSWLPYPNRAAVHLTLQDFDKVSQENWGTSILVQRSRYGMLKTRAAEEWATAIGFDVKRVDRALDAHLRRSPMEPAIALAGLDKIPVRRVLGTPGFEYVIDAGLGASVRNFRDFRINVFGPGDDPRKHFEGVPDRQREEIERVLQLPAYQKLLATAGDGGCGTFTLAGQPIVMPFVSALAATLAVTQAIRLASWHAPYRTLVGSMQDLRNVRANLGKPPMRG